MERPHNPFENIESAYEYMALLREAIDDAYAGIQADIAEARAADGAHRRVEAFLLVEHKLNQLRRHTMASLVLLNDLRTLRRLLLRERESSDQNADDES